MDDRSQMAVILIVEDQPTNMLLARTTLVRAGHRVIEAVDGHGARLQLQHERPDLILMDIGLPGQDGLSLTREFKSTQELVDIPIVAVTAHAMQADRDQALAAGCSDVLHKPYSPGQLVDLVREQLRAVSRSGSRTGRRP